jgi:hypothetical protein
VTRTQKVLLGAAGVVLGLPLLAGLFGFLLPESVILERSVVVDADPEDIYPLIGDFERGWPQWSPWSHREDPEMVLRYSGPDHGVGASQSWDSPLMGDGRMVITEADPGRGVVFDVMLMRDSFRLSSSLICEPADEGTRVVWSDRIHYGNNPFRRYMQLLVSGPLGDQMDQGLSQLQRQAEARAVAR